MPKSKVRKKPESARSATPAQPTRALAPSPRWYPIVIAILLVVGLAYIVVYYLAGENIPFMESLQNWNIAIGFAIMVLGLGLTVRWR